MTEPHDPRLKTDFNLIKIESYKRSRDQERCSAVRQANHNANAVDALSALIAAALLSGLTALVVNLQPIIMGALADGRGLNDGDLGRVSAIFIGANTISVMTAPWWVRRWSWRMTAMLGVAATVLISLAGIFIAGLAGIAVIFTGLGLATGVIGATAFACLGDNHDPDRAYGASIIAQSMLAAFAAWPMSGWVIPGWGVTGMFVALSVLSGVGWLALPWLPARGRVRAEESDDRRSAGLVSRASIPAAVSLLACTFFAGGILGFWYFMERIGTARGVSPQQIGAVVSLSALSTIVTAGVVAWFGTRLSSWTYMWIGTTLLLSGYGLIVSPGTIPFMIGVQLFALGWGFAQPPYYALARKIDVTGRLFVVAPGTVGIAGVLIGSSAGAIIARAGYDGLVLLSGGLIVIATLLLLVAVRAAGVAALSDAPGVEDIVREPPVHLLHAEA